MNWKFTLNLRKKLKKLDISRLIIDPHNDLLTVGMIAQMLERCTDIAEVRVAVPVQACNFPAFLGAAEAALKCDDPIHLWLIM